MKPYRGVIKITCSIKKCIEKKKDMDCHCLKCVYAGGELVDLDENTLFVFDKVKKPIKKKEK
jgi:hypothetical protein